MLKHLIISVLLFSIEVGVCAAQGNRPNDSHLWPRKYYIADTRGLRLRLPHELYPMAMAGDAFANYLMGRYLEAGNGTRDGRPDISMALPYYNYAIDQGVVNAEYAVGLLGQSGRLRRKDGRPDTAWVER